MDKIETNIFSEGYRRCPRSMDYFVCQYVCQYVSPSVSVFNMLIGSGYSQ